MLNTVVVSWHAKQISTVVGSTSLLKAGKCVDPAKPYLDLTEPTFLGLLIMISLYKSLKR